MIHGYARMDEAEGVLKIYYETECMSMCPGLTVFSSMIWCLCHCGKVDDAEKYLRDYERSIAGSKCEYIRDVYRW